MKGTRIVPRPTALEISKDNTEEALSYGARSPASLRLWWV